MYAFSAYLFQTTIELCFNIIIGIVQITVCTKHKMQLLLQICIIIDLLHGYGHSVCMCQIFTHENHCSRVEKILLPYIAWVIFVG